MKKIKKRKLVVLIAEYEGKIVARVVAELEKGRQEHVAQIGIAVKKEFRGRGQNSPPISVSGKIDRRNRNGVLFVPKNVKTCIF